MTRYRGYNRRRSNRGYAPAATPETHTDALYSAARALSNQRNELNYAWVSDVGAEGAAKQVEHYTQLIALVGECDKAWRAVAARDGVLYTPCVDCGWLPRYQAALSHWKQRFVELTNEAWELTTYDSATHKPAHVRGES